MGHKEVTHLKEPEQCWACNGSGKKYQVDWENPLSNPPNFSLLDCLKALDTARYKVATNFERTYLREMINVLSDAKSQD